MRIREKESEGGGPCHQCMRVWTNGQWTKRKRVKGRENKRENKGNQNKMKGVSNEGKERRRRRQESIG